MVFLLFYQIGFFNFDYRLSLEIAETTHIIHVHNLQNIFMTFPEKFVFV